MSLFGWLFGGGGVTSTGTQGGFFGLPFGARTTAGAHVSEHTAVRLPAVYAAVGIISDAVAQLPIRVVQVREDGSKTPRPDHPVSYLLNRRPNPRMTAYTWRNTAQSHALLWGNAYGEVQRRRDGAAAGLWLALPDRTWPELLTDGTLIYHTTIDGRSRDMEIDDVVHVPAMGFDGVVGYSPVAVARQAMGLGLSMEEFAGRFFSGDAKSGGFIKHPGKLSDTALQNLRDSFSEDGQGGLQNAHKPKVLEEGMDFLNTTIPPEDAQFLESREFQIAEIARMYRIPLHMLQSHEKTTSWGSGVESLARGFVDYTLQPWLTRWEQELNEKLFTQRERESGFQVRHDISALLRGDSKTRAEYYRRALDPKTGWLTRDEVRNAEDLDPLTPGERGGFGS